MNTTITHSDDHFFSINENSQAIKLNHWRVEESHLGFKIYKADQTTRLKKIELTKDIVGHFLQKVEKISVTDLEYIATNRFFLAHTLDMLTGNSLSNFLRKILKNRSKGAFILSVENFYPKAETDFDKILKIQTAISFMFGKANLDAMSGLFYARFTVRNQDNSDSHLRKFGNRLTLHNDGTFIHEKTDYVLMSKIVEENVQGGNSLLLHLDDWEELNVFYNHALSKKKFKFSSPPSKNINHSIYHPVFHSDQAGLPCMAYIDQFVKPQNPEEGIYLHALSQSLEKSKNSISFELPVGSSIICNNNFWLHGRDKFLPTQNLCRELMRQRGTFFENLRN